jgi:hypothetical protein
MAQYGPGQGPRGFLTAGRQYGMGPVIESAVANQMVATSAAAQSVIRQQLTPLLSSVAFPTVGGSVVNAGTQTAFIDANGANQNSGFTQNNASQTFDRGLTKSGTRSFLLGMGISVWGNSGNTATVAGGGAVTIPLSLGAGEMQTFIDNTSLKLNIGSAEQQLGKVGCWPAGIGAFSTGQTSPTLPGYATNGYPSLDSLTYFSDVVVLDPFINFSVDVTLQTPITLTNSIQPANEPECVAAMIWFPRIIDFSTQQKAGA